MSKKGFTLIELLVVISIISLLSSVVLSATGSARAKARDAKRIAEIREIRTALEMYRLDNGGYPQVDGLTHEALSMFVSSGYMGKVPQDPTRPNDYHDGFLYMNLTSDNSFGKGDAYPQTTFTLRFVTEGQTILGPNGYYCATSVGIHSESSEGDNFLLCDQR